MIDLTRNAQSFKVDAVDNNQRLPIEAKHYLHEIKLSNLIIRCCTFKDVGSNSPVVSDGLYANYRLAMLTIPAGFEYVNYDLNPQNEVIIASEPRQKLAQGVHSLALLNVYNPDDGEAEQAFHLCDDKQELVSVFDSPPYACVTCVTSLIPTPHSTNNRHFHLFFYGGYYFIPLVTSQGAIVYYIIAEDNVELLNKFAQEALSRTDTKKDFWQIRNIVAYDMLDILTSKDVTPGILK
jgi:hypothetical protein